MKIRPNQRFRDGGTTYESGQDYNVPDTDAVFFIRSGWATSDDYAPPGVTPAPAEVDIQPDNVSAAGKASQPKTEG